MFTASFGQGGFRTTRVHRGPQQRAAGGDAPPENRSLFVQLLPILILFGFSILSSLPSIFTALFSTPDPGYSFSPSRPYTSERLTSTYKVAYYVSQTEFSKHGIFESIPEAYRSSPQAGDYSALLRGYEAGIERSYVAALRNACSQEYDYREARIERNRGLFGIGADWDTIKKIQAEKMPNCEKLQQLGLLSS